MPVRFGQIIVGAPGAGKTTYCEGMRQYLNALGREVAIVNLDPANDNVPYEAAIELSELVSLETVMDEMKLGPNGGLIYCLEYLETNMDWLLAKLESLGPRKYLIFDFPGQLELFTHCASVLKIVQTFTKEDYRLTAVNLIDAHHCSDASKFIAASLLALTMMVQLELPHINVLSKVDLMEQFGPLPFNLEFFCDVMDLPKLLPYLDNAPAAADDEDFDDNSSTTGPSESEAHRNFLLRRRRLNAAMCELVEDFSLVSFETLNIQDAESVGRVLAKIDKSNGYIFGATESKSSATAAYASSLFRAVSSDTSLNAERTLLVQEKYLGNFPFKEK